MRTRHQDPKILKRTDGSRPFYEIRPFVPVFTENGITRKQKHIRLGYCDETTMKQARTAKSEIMSTVNQGRLVLSAQIPFKTLVDRFVASRLPSLNPATQMKYRSHLNNHILPFFGTMRICDITKQTVEAWIGTKTSLAWWTRSDLRSILSAIFTAAKDWGLYSGPNPTEGVRLGVRQEKREKRLLPDVLMNHLWRSLPDLIGFLIFLAVVTGLRVSELLGLKWEDVDFENATITVRRRFYRGSVSIPKTPASKRVRQIGSLVQEFTRRVQGHNLNDWIFQENGEPLNDRAILKNILKPAARRLGLDYPGFGFHCFRREFITWKQQSGATPLEAMKAAGHTKLSTTFDYTLLDPARDRAQTEAIITRLLNAPNQSPISPSLPAISPQMIENSGGSGATRTPDLYRVKVVEINELRVNDVESVDSKEASPPSNQTGISPEPENRVLFRLNQTAAPEVLEILVSGVVYRYQKEIP